jgi:hypothetical protein
MDNQLEADAWVKAQLKKIKNHWYGTYSAWVRPDLMDLCIAGLEKHGWVFIKSVGIGSGFDLHFKMDEFLVEEWIDGIKNVPVDGAIITIDERIIDVLIKREKHPLYQFMKVSQNQVYVLNTS